MNNKVSVIIPYFKNIRYIDRSILSVLNQTYKNFEVIVVDQSDQFNSKIYNKYR